MGFDVVVLFVFCSGCRNLPMRVLVLLVQEVAVK